MPKMTIEYVTLGVTSPIPGGMELVEGFLDVMKDNHETSLRRKGVFGEIQHRVGTYPERIIEETGEVIPAWSQLSSSGKQMVKEIEETK